MQNCGGFFFLNWLGTKAIFCNIYILPPPKGKFYSLFKNIVVISVGNEGKIEVKLASGCDLSVHRVNLFFLGQITFWPKLQMTDSITGPYVYRKYK